MNINPIATISTPYKTKFAIPRQSGLVPSAHGTIHFYPEYSSIDNVRSLEQFSHIWLIFCFHQTARQGWKPLVRPPRLGGNTQVGVFSSRSPFRPNPIGMSLVKLEQINRVDNQAELIVSGIDLVDGTPILDIKPYISYSDSKKNAVNGFVSAEPETIPVVIPKPLQSELKQIETRYPGFFDLVKQVLEQDPRPAYRRGKPDTNSYGVSLYDYDVRFHYPQTDQIELLEVVTL